MFESLKLILQHQLRNISQELFTEFILVKLLIQIFKPSIGNESLYKISNDNGVRVVNSALSKHFTFKSIMFQHRSIHTFTWTSPEQTDHTLIDCSRHSSVFDIQTF
jgi:hypothetical protein